MDDFSIPVVYLHDEDIIGFVTSLGAHVSRVEYESGGHKYNIVMPNEDFTIINYITFLYEET